MVTPYSKLNYIYFIDSLDYFYYLLLVGFHRLVTPYSKLELRVLSSNSIRTDTLLGQVTIILYSLLEETNGKCKSVVLVVCPYCHCHSAVISQGFR